MQCDVFNNSEMKKNHAPEIKREFRELNKGYESKDHNLLMLISSYYLLSSPQAFKQSIPNNT